MGQHRTWQLFALFILANLVLATDGQQNGPPKILPIATADSYPEGSSINLICTVSGGQRRGLTLSWTINGELLDDQKLRGFSRDDQQDLIANNVAINTDDADISILKIRNATLKNSGHYTCTAKNPLGQDSTSVDIVINVELKWIKTPKDKLEVGLGQQVSLECDALGSPQPTIKWLRHSSDRANQDTTIGSVDDAHVISKGKLLKIQKAQHADSGLYECMAGNGAGPDLRRFVQLIVRGTTTLEMADQEEFEDIVVEFEGNFDLDTVLDKRLQLIGLDTDKPVLKIDSKFYNLDIKESIGTKLLFSNNKHDGKLEFSAKTDKQISAHRVMIKPK